MKLDKPIQVDMNMINELLSLKNKILLLKRSSHLLVVTDFKYESRITKKVGLFKNKTKELLFLTELEINIWNYEKKYWGIMNNRDQMQHLIHFNNLRSMRNNYEDYFKSAIDAAGMEIVRKK